MQTVLQYPEGPQKFSYVKLTEAKKDGAGMDTKFTYNNESVIIEELQDAAQTVQMRVGVGAPPRTISGCSDHSKPELKIDCTKVILNIFSAKLFCYH